MLLGVFRFQKRRVKWLHPLYFFSIFFSYMIYITLCYIGYICYITLCYIGFLDLNEKTSFCLSSFGSTQLYMQDLDLQHFYSTILEIISLLSWTFAATGWRTCLTKYLIMTEWKSIQLYFAGWANLSNTGHILGSSFSVVNVVQFPART